MSFHVLGTGSALPDLVAKNDALAEFLDTSDEWIGTRTGIRERRLLSGQSLTELGAEAARRAIADAGITPGDVDTVICSTLQGDCISPSMSILLSGLVGIPARHVLDVNMGCTGFLYSMDLADTFIRAGKSERVLVVCAESMSRFSDWTDRSTCVLFGDGAGAAVLERGAGLVEISMNIEPDAEGKLVVPGFAGNCPIGGHAERECYLRMNGQEIYRFAVASSVRGIEEMLDKHGLTTADVSCFVLHQANLRILESARRKLGQPEEKFPHNLERLGNTSSASIPILLDEINRAGRLKRGDRIVFSAFGAGLAAGTALLVW